MLTSELRDRLRLPLIAAPMTAVSGPELVIAACRGGVIGSFPAHNARTTEELDAWLTRIAAALDADAAPVAPNLVVHRSNPRLADDVACLARHRVPLVITSVGSPAAALGPLRDAGCLVFADVASMRHVDRALALGVDGLVLLTAGAGGQTGWHNPLAFLRAVRREYTGPVVLAGGIADGTALLAAQVAGADLAYMGTKFIATEESMAGAEYRDALVAATLDDVTQTSGPTGLPANLLSGKVDPTAGAGQPAGFRFDVIAGATKVWAAGHSVCGVDAVLGVAELIERTRREYLAAAEAMSRNHIR